MIKEITNIDGKFYEKCEVAVLPTKNISPFGYISEIKSFHIYSNSSQFGNPYSLLDNTAIPQHLYILSNEEIKEGDWLLADGYNNMHPKHLGVAKADKEQLSAILQGFTAKKIIATTDESLMILGKFSTTPGNVGYHPKPFPRPSNEFLKKFCELNGIWEVLVEYDNSECLELCGGMCAGDCPHGIRYTKLKTAPDNTITIKPVQEEKLYTRDEAIGLIRSFDSDVRGYHWTKEQEDWVKENL